MVQPVSFAANTFRLRRLSDQVVASRTLEGDPAAFSELHRRYKKRISIQCASRLSGSIAAEDAVQETFLRVLRAAPQQIENVEAWLLTIARNVCLDLLRKASNVEEVVDTDDQAFQNSMPVADTPTHLLRRENARQVFLALRRLPTRYRTALTLREFHGMSSAEISEAMSVSQGAVDPMVSRARDAFGVAYAEVSGFPDSCRLTVERIYRELGSGIDEAEKFQMAAHIARCPRCRAEHKRAKSPRYLQGLLPFLVAKMPNLGLIADAVTRSAEAPAVMQSFPVMTAAAVATLSTAVVLTPIALRGVMPWEQRATQKPTVVTEAFAHGDGGPGSESAGTNVGAAEAVLEPTAVGVQTARSGDFAGQPSATAEAADPGASTPPPDASTSELPTAQAPEDSLSSTVKPDAGPAKPDPPADDPIASATPADSTSDDGWAEIPDEAIVVAPVTGAE